MIIPPVTIPPIVIGPITIPPITIPPITLPPGGGNGGGGNGGDNGGDNGDHGGDNHHGGNDNGDDHGRGDNGRDNHDRDNHDERIDHAIGEQNGGGEQNAATISRARGQVAQVPVGGVETGDGSTSDGGDLIYVLLGALALGGTGLIVGLRRKA